MGNTEDISKKIEEVTNEIAEAIKKVDCGMKQIYVALNHLIEYNNRIIKSTR